MLFCPISSVSLESFFFFSGTFTKSRSFVCRMHPSNAVDTNKVRLNDKYQECSCSLRIQVSKMQLLQSDGAAAAAAAAQLQPLCVASFPVDSFAIRSNLMAADNPVLLPYM